MMKGWEFQECLAHIGCMGRSGFIRCWGEETGAYLWQKFTNPIDRDGYDKIVAKFVCYLDNRNSATLMKYLEDHLKEIKAEGCL